MRALLALGLVITILTTVFILVRIMPGDPTLMVGGSRMSEEVHQRMLHDMGLDQPLYMQYLGYVIGVFTGNYGTSWWAHESVWNMIMTYFPSTLELVIAAMLFAIAVGFTTGVFAAERRDSAADQVLRGFTLFGVSLPIFWIALMLQLIIAVSLGWLPVARETEIAPVRITGMVILDSILTMNYPALIDGLRHLILPTIALGLYITAFVSRLTRANLIEALSQDYVVTAKAKGLPQRMVVYKHALRNAIIPVMTVMIYQFAWLMGGSVVTEVIFSWPGIGWLYYQAITIRDFPIIQGICGFVAIWLGILLFAMDLSAYYFDPRIRVG
jgi:peptide/nickel transport system permease protein